MESLYPFSDFLLRVYAKSLLLKSAKSVPSNFVDKELLSMNAMSR